jgi:hypothetical protein
VTGVGSVDADLIITSTSAEAAFSVSLTWKNKADES